MATLLAANKLLCAVSERCCPLLLDGCRPLSGVTAASMRAAAMLLSSARRCEAQIASRLAEVVDDDDGVRERVADHDPAGMLGCVGGWGGVGRGL